MIEDTYRLGVRLDSSCEERLKNISETSNYSRNELMKKGINFLLETAYRKYYRNKIKEWYYRQVTINRLLLPIIALLLLSQGFYYCLTKDANFLLFWGMESLLLILAGCVYLTTFRKRLNNYHRILKKIDKILRDPITYPDKWMKISTAYGNIYYSEEKLILDYSRYLGTKVNRSNQEKTGLHLIPGTIAVVLTPHHIGVFDEVPVKNSKNGAQK